MKRNRFIISTILLTFIFVYSINAQKKIKTYTFPIDSDTKDLILKVGANDGNIKISGYEGKDVIIDVIEYTLDSLNDQPKNVVPKLKGEIKNLKYNYSIDTIDTDGLKKIKNKSIRYEINKEGNKVFDTSDSLFDSFRTFEFDIKVPANYTIITNSFGDIDSKSTGYEIIKEGNKIYVTSNIPIGSFKSFGFNIKIPANCSVIANSFGDIEIKEASGDFELNTVNGSINATGITGSVVANTVNGEINVYIKKAKLNALMAFSSVDGHVDVTLPVDIKATFKMNSDFGEIYSDFDMETIDNDIVIPKNSPDKGKYNINVKNWIIAKINGGGPEITFKTLSGNIYIRKK
jgi:hypothetical protein